MDEAGDWAAYRWEPTHDPAPEWFGTFAHLFADERTTLAGDIDGDYFEADDPVEAEYSVDADLVTDVELPADGAVTSAEASP